VSTLVLDKELNKKADLAGRALAITRSWKRYCHKPTLIVNPEGDAAGYFPGETLYRGTTCARN